MAKMSRRARASLSAAYRRARESQVEQAVLTVASAAGAGAAESRGLLPADLMGFDTKLVVGGGLAALAMTNSVRGKNRQRVLALASGMVAPYAYAWGQTV